MTPDTYAVDACQMMERAKHADWVLINGHTFDDECDPDYLQDIANEFNCVIITDWSDAEISRFTTVSSQGWAPTRLFAVLASIMVTLDLRGLGTVSEVMITGDAVGEA